MPKPAPDLQAITSMLRLRRGVYVPAGEKLWNFGLLTGCLAELSGNGSTAQLTCAFGVVLDAQQQGEPVAWLTTTTRSFFPPDVAAGGIDLDSLVVVRLPEARQLPRAADHLMRSGAFGLLVLDLGNDANIPVPMLSRLSGLAQKHDAAILCLTEKKDEVPSLGSLVSLRGNATRLRSSENGFTCTVHILKDKRRGPGWIHEEVCRGPDGLC